jgi:hypothetical protein
MRAMPDWVLPWVFRVLWAAVPFTAWPAVDEALRAHSGDVRSAVAIACWVVWALILIATLVPHPVGLTAVRCVIPGLAACVIATATSKGPSGLAMGGAAAWAVILVLLAFLPQTGMFFVNGPAYPNERRYPLGIPASLLVGPIELSWVMLVGLPAAAVLLLAAHQWLLGAVAAVAAVAAIYVLGRAMYGLSRRWVVFVPAGLVLHDSMSLQEPVLFRRQTIEDLRPAAADTDSLDLTQRALGLAIELRLREKVPMGRVMGTRKHVEEGASARLLFTPTRPGAVLAEADSRHLPVGR